MRFLIKPTKPVRERCDDHPLGERRLVAEPWMDEVEVRNVKLRRQQAVSHAMPPPGPNPFFAPPPEPPMVEPPVDERRRAPTNADEHRRPPPLPEYGQRRVAEDVLRAENLVVLWRLTGGDVQRCVQIASSVWRVHPEVVLQALIRCLSEASLWPTSPPSTTQTSPDPWHDLRPLGSWPPPCMANSHRAGASRPQRSAPPAGRRITETPQPLVGRPTRAQRLVPSHGAEATPAKATRPLDRERERAASGGGAGVRQHAKTSIY